jgi:hypothetical protein
MMSHSCGLAPSTGAAGRCFCCSARKPWKWRSPSCVARARKQAGPLQSICRQVRPAASAVQITATPMSYVEDPRRLNSVHSLLRGLGIYLRAFSYSGSLSDTQRFKEKKSYSYSSAFTNYDKKTISSFVSDRIPYFHNQLLHRI